MQQSLIEKAAFTAGDKGGNPAGVYIGTEFPSDAEMLEIAAKLGHSETVFSVKQPDGVWRTRYFSPEGEVDFCGHATIALGAALGEKFGAASYPLQINNASIQVTANEDGSATLLSPETSSQPLTDSIKQQVLKAFGLTDVDLEASIPDRLINAGNNHVLLPLKQRATLAAMSYDFDAMRQLMQAENIVTIALIWQDEDKTLHVRNAFAFGGVVEDPATGAAASAIAGYFRELGLLDFTNGTAELLIHQGDDMGSPSRLKITVPEPQGQGVEVSGTARTL